MYQLGWLLFAAVLIVAVIGGYQWLANRDEKRMRKANLEAYRRQR